MAFDNMAKLSWIYDLYRMGQSTELRNDPRKVQQQIMMHIVQGMEAVSGSLSLREGETDDLMLVAGIGIPDNVIGSRRKFGEGIIGRVAESGEALLLDGVDAGKRHGAMDSGERKVAPASAICWPLKHDTRLLGVLCVNRGEGQPVFTPQDEEYGKVMVNLITIVIENMRLHTEQEMRIHHLHEMNSKLEDAQAQLVQSEKMASIGQLAAGVAHEINNPIGYVNSNLGALEKYLADVFKLVAAYEQAEAHLSDTAVLASIQALKKKLDLPFLRDDTAALMSESKEGISRVKKIVQDLKDFSHADTGDEWQESTLQQGLDSTLNIVWNELKYKCEVKKEYAQIPDIECLPSQLNQVFMNMMVNAGHAMEEKGVLILRTGREDEMVWVEVADNGKGMPPEIVQRIFDPFFTTKPVGTGTGLGLSLSLGIIKKHNGRIEVNSVLGTGTTFRVWLPIKHVSLQEEASPMATV
ncbi:MAG: GAF domain-containing protein [Burkholderiales bacterium]|nr:GAF domain-containing protein [Burkholderiales bacterium]